MPPGVYTLEDLRQYGRKKGWCPYFLARHMISFANVVVFNYQYMIDPKVLPADDCHGKVAARCPPLWQACCPLPDAMASSLPAAGCHGVHLGVCLKLLSVKCDPPQECH